VTPQHRPLCAATARLRGDAMAGTVPTTRRWLLIEHPGPWQHDALGSIGLPAGVLEEVVAAVRGQGARALLVRRPGRRLPDPDRAWGVLDQRAGWSRWGRWSEPDDLMAAVMALSEEPAPPYPPAEQVLLVCTHGRHDTCCAVFGRPVANALAERWPEQTWECSHLGGDRFAANLLVAPDGLYYGRLDAETAVDVVAGHLRGEVDGRHLRGSAAMPPALQAALVAAHERFGPAPAQAIRAEALDMLSPNRWRVRLAGTAPLPPHIDVVVARTSQPPALLTCHARAESAATVFTAEEPVVVA